MAQGINFNLSTGVVGAAFVAAPSGSRIQSIDNGWYRCSITVSSSSTNTFRIYVSDGSNPSLGNVLIQNSQAEAGDIATAYIPTTTAAVTVGPVANVPRLDYLGSTCPRLLLEPQRTNLAIFSEQFDNSNWTKTNTTVTANTTVSPDGYTNADTIAFTATAGAVCQRPVGGTYESQTHTVSVYARVASGTATFRLKCTHGGVLDYISSDFTATTTWQRFTFSATFGATIGTSLVYGVQNGSNGTAKSVIFYGFQLEANASYATSYIPTLAASATRGGEFASSPLNTTSANWTLFVDTDFVPYQEILNLYFGTSTGRFVSFYQSFNYFRIVVSAGAGVVAGRVMSDTAGRKKVVLQNDGTDCIVFVNGVKLGAINTSGASPLTGTGAASFTFYGGGGTVASIGKVRQFLQFHSKLTDAQCIELTTL